MTPSRFETSPDYGSQEQFFDSLTGLYFENTKD